MPKLLFARPPLDPKEEQQIRKLAGSRHAPGDWITRARMIVGSGPSFSFSRLRLRSRGRALHRVLRSAPRGDSLL